MIKSKKELFNEKRKIREKNGTMTVSDIKTKEHQEKIKSELSSFKKMKNSFSVSHSYTSSSCSFDKSKQINPLLMTSDAKYNIRIERLLPKHLRRIRFQKLTDKQIEDREAFFDEVRDNPKQYRHHKGIRSFLISESNKKSHASEQRKLRKKKLNTKHHPWLLILNDTEKRLSKDLREVAIRAKYHDIMNSPDIDTEITFNPHYLEFIHWYNDKSQGKILESDVSDSDIFPQVSPKNKTIIKSPKSLPPPKYDDDSDFS
jgi:hypothetical protein